MSNRLELDEHKRKEYIGDALYAFLSREYYFKIDRSKVDYLESRKVLFYINSNEFMGAVGKEIGLLSTNTATIASVDIYGNSSLVPYADELEVCIYQQYLEGGIDKTKDFFITKVVPFCPSLKEAKAFAESKKIKPEIHS